MAKAGGKRAITKTYLIPADLVVQIIDTAEEDGVPMSQIVSDAIREYMNKRSPE